MIYEYECQKCKKVQERIHRMAETNTEPCDNEECKAPVEDLKKVMSLTAGKHISWSKWSV